MTMTMHQVAQRVQDLDRAVEFYEDLLGLRKIARFEPPGLAFFDLGSSRLLLEAGAPASLIYLMVDGLESTIESLGSKGVPIVGPPHRIFIDEDGLFGEPGVEEWMAFITDSEGNTIGLVERRRPE